MRSNPFQLCKRSIALVLAISLTFECFSAVPAQAFSALKPVSTDTASFTSQALNPLLVVAPLQVAASVRKLKGQIAYAAATFSLPTSVETTDSVGIFTRIGQYIDRNEWVKSLVFILAGVVATTLFLQLNNRRKFGDVNRLAQKNRISGNGNGGGGFSRGDHEAYHRDGHYRDLIHQIANRLSARMEIPKNVGADGNPVDDFHAIWRQAKEAGLVRTSGEGRHQTKRLIFRESALGTGDNAWDRRDSFGNPIPNDEDPYLVYETWDGIKVIIDHDIPLYKDHAGRSGIVFARNPTSARHELRELREVAMWAVSAGIATPRDVAEGNLGPQIRDWLNNRQVSLGEQRRRAHEFDEMSRTSHTKGVIAEEPNGNSVPENYRLRFGDIGMRRVIKDPERDSDSDGIIGSGSPLESTPARKSLWAWLPSLILLQTLVPATVATLDKVHLLFRGSNTVLEQPQVSSTATSQPNPKKEALEHLFLRNDGVDFITTASALGNFGILSQLHRAGGLTDSDIRLTLRRRGVGYNSGYWDIAMRLLADQGWIVREKRWLGLRRGNYYQLTELGRHMTQVDHVKRFADAGNFIRTELSSVEALEHFFSAHPRGPPSITRVVTLENYLQYVVRDWGIRRDIRNTDPRDMSLPLQLTSPLLHVTAFTFKERGVFDLFAKGPVSRAEVERQLATGREAIDKDRVKIGMDVLVKQGWLRPAAGGLFEITDMGRLESEHALKAGVPLSYLPMLSKVETLLTGTPEQVTAVYARDAYGNEAHVARRINVKGSGAAHGPYFKLMMERLDALFNRDSIDEQPQFVMDTGSGDGEFLKTAYQYILNNTKRGEWIKQHPNDPRYQLLMVGADYNEVARHETKATLDKHGIPNQVIFGDINDPDSIAPVLRKIPIVKGSDIMLDPRRGLHTSTFLIHNRPYLQSKNPPRHASTSVGAFVVTDKTFAAQGYKVSNEEVEQQLFEMLSRWKPYWEQFGLVTTELFSVPDTITAANRGSFAGTSYDATHFYSAQYTVEVPVFLKIAARAGLRLLNAELRPAGLPDGHAPTAVLHFDAIGNAPQKSPDSPFLRAA